MAGLVWSRTTHRIAMVLLLLAWLTLFLFVVWIKQYIIIAFEIDFHPFSVQSSQSVSVSPLVSTDRSLVAYSFGSCVRSVFVCVAVSCVHFIFTNLVFSTYTTYIIHTFTNNPIPTLYCTATQKHSHLRTTHFLQE